MESRFARDFSQVRLHSDAPAQASAKAVGARAYTIGNDIVFGPAGYAPGTAAGRRLLAHELAHVAQQPAGSNGAGGMEPAEDARLEAEAERASRLAIDGYGPMPALSAAAAGMMRQQEEPEQRRQAPDAAGAPAPTPAQAPATPAATWSTDMLTIVLSGPDPNCFAVVAPRHPDTYSQCRSPIRAPFCQSVTEPFEVSFYIDRMSAPRPQPFTPPTVRAAFKFTTTYGAVTTNIDRTDSNPRYAGANHPLEPNFGRDFPIGTAESGRLRVILELKDSSGVDLKLDDRIDFIVEPCA